MTLSIRRGKDPRQKYEEPRHPLTKVYFIGDFMYPIDHETGKPKVIEIVLSADGRNPVKMPPIGGFIEVPEHVAKRLIRNGRMPYPQTHPLHGKAMRDTLTLDAEFARVKAQAFKTGRPVEAVVAAENVSKLSREELLAALARLDAEQPVYQDGKVLREDPPVVRNDAAEYPVKYQDETPEAQAEHAEETVYQDEVDKDGQPVGKTRGRPKSQKSED